MTKKGSSPRKGQDSKKGKPSKIGEKTARKGGPSNIDPDVGKGTQFSADNQPSPEAKSAGHKKRRTLKDLLSIAINGKDEGSKNIRRIIANYLDISEDEVKKMTLEDAMNLRQIDKAIKKGDTTAFQAIMDRVYGKPVSRNEIGGFDGEPINISPIAWVKSQEQGEDEAD